MPFFVVFDISSILRRLHHVYLTLNVVQVFHVCIGFLVKYPTERTAKKNKQLSLENIFEMYKQPSNKEALLSDFLKKIFVHVNSAESILPPTHTALVRPLKRTETRR